MTNLTPKESEVLLKLFKDFDNDYNANSISKKVGITPRGALKILKNLKKQNFLVSKQLGKAVFYKINFEDDYALKVLETLLIGESRENASRWLAEFKELFEDVEIVIIFGSIITNSKKANDVDLLLVFKEKKIKKVKQFIRMKNGVLLKPIHPVMQTPNDVKVNLRKKDEVVLNILRRGRILYGHDKLIDLVKNVTSI